MASFHFYAEQGKMLMLCWCWFTKYEYKYKYFEAEWLSERSFLSSVSILHKHGTGIVIFEAAGFGGFSKKLLRILARTWTSRVRGELWKVTFINRNCCSFLSFWNGKTLESLPQSKTDPPRCVWSVSISWWCSSSTICTFNRRIRQCWAILPPSMRS